MSTSTTIQTTMILLSTQNNLLQLKAAERDNGTEFPTPDQTWFCSSKSITQQLPN